jgi:DNA-binding XRE family transcriptional regulator
MKSKKLIYALCCPFTNEIHYIGKSTQGMIRPMQHLNKSHSEKINEWVNDLKQIGHVPSVNVLEYVSLNEDLDSRERYWIQLELNKNSFLLNSCLVSPLLISNDLEIILGNGAGMEHLRIAKFVKERRKQIKLDQKTFAEKAGVALTVLRKIEQGKTNLNYESILQVLKMFGCTLDIIKIKKRI